MTEQTTRSRVPQERTARERCWRELLPRHRLRFDTASCLPMRYRGAGCTRCAAICPTCAISFEPGSLVVSADCTGCGRCAAECPMGAIDAGTRIAAPAAASRAEAVRVSCWRVPPAQRAHGALAVPCLGGLDSAWLIQAYLAAGDGPVLCDHGQCAACPSSGTSTCPVEPALAQARDLLEYMGVPVARLPRRVTVEPSVEGDAPADESAQPGGEIDRELTLSRRGFLGELGRRTSRATVALYAPMNDPVEDAGPTRLARPPRASRNRQRLLEACLGVARQDGYRLPRPLLRSARIGSECCDSGLCRAVCPTGALQREPVGAGFAVVFSALRCIDCGACAAICPQQAFELGDCQDHAWHRPQMLIQRVERDCSQCGTPFTAQDDSTICDACAKSTVLARSLFHQLFKVGGSEAINKGSGPVSGAD